MNGLSGAARQGITAPVQADGLLADLKSMWAGADFGRILDEKLEADTFARASRQDEPPAAWRPGPRPVFLFGDLRTGFTAGPGRPATTSGASPWTPVYGARPEAQPGRPARRLTPPQRLALDALRALGAAALPDDFTDAEIKSAFRALARRYHPDRHPRSSEADRARLARSFAAACDAYRTLTTAVH